MSQFFCRFVVDKIQQLPINTFYMSLNRKSQWMVDNVCQGLRRFNPADDISKYDEGSDTQCIKWTRNGRLLRIYKFHANSSGVITSMTVYGVDIPGEYNTISRSKVAFGLPVTAISTKQGPEGMYVDVTFGNY